MPYVSMYKDQGSELKTKYHRQCTAWCTFIQAGALFCSDNEILAILLRIYEVFCVL